MKKIIYFLILNIIILNIAIINSTNAQTPVRFNYQAVVRDNAGNVMEDQNVAITINILKGSIEGTQVFTETHNTTTNSIGLINLQVGAFSSLDNISWGDDIYFLEVLVNGTYMGASQLLSVPYALHAQTADEFTGEIEINETDPVFVISPAAGIEFLDISNWNETYTWGDHTQQGYLTDYTVTEEDVTSHQGALQITEEQITNLKDYLTEETDPLFTTWDKSEGIVITENQISDLQEYITQESDPFFILNFDLTDANEGDLLFFNGQKWVKFTPNYLTEYIETQTLADVLVLGNHGNALQIKNIADPTEEQDASTKKYVDSLFTELLIRIEELEQIIDQNFICGISTVSFYYFVNPVTYGTVVGANNRCWLDRNLGASRVATSSTDEFAYGDLYQWGRATDGHQERISGTTTTLSNSDNPGHGGFIISNYEANSDWRNPQNDNLWQGVDGINNPCPAGFRLPTTAEWNAERASWSSNNAAGAFDSPLKLTMGGLRGSNNGLIGDEDLYGDYWSSDVYNTASRGLVFNSTSASGIIASRANGFSVRCIMD